MYTLESNLVGRPIVSLQTGQVVAWAGPPVLDMATLEVMAFTCHTPHNNEPLLVMAADIRQYATDCLVIDDEEQLTSPEDIVRFRNTPDQQYSPLGKLVIADTGRRVGIVDDYNINLDTSRVHCLFIKQSFWRSWFAPDVIIDRTQIIDITPEKITVRDSTLTDTVISPKQIPEIHP